MAGREKGVGSHCLVGIEFQYWADGNFLEMGSEDGCTVQINLKSLNCPLKNG